MLELISNFYLKVFNLNFNSSHLSMPVKIRLLLCAWQRLAGEGYLACIQIYLGRKQEAKNRIKEILFVLDSLNKMQLKFLSIKERWRLATNKAGFLECQEDHILNLIELPKLT